jgi:lipopolysaccharide export system permease protein
LGINFMQREQRSAALQSSQLSLRSRRGLPRHLPIRSLRAMRLLDRYLLREMLGPLGYCLGGFTIFWMSFDLIAQLEEYQRLRLGPLEIAELYALRLPELLALLGPIGLMLALLYALTQHARHHEITAMRAAGVSLWRLSLPYLLVGLLTSLAVLGIAEWVAPRTGALAERLLERHQPAGTLPSDWMRNLTFHNERGGRYWHVQAYHRKTCELQRPRISWLLPGGARREISAERGGRLNDEWVFFNVQELFYPAPGQIPVLSQTNELRLPEFTETPAQIESEVRVRSVDRRRAAKHVEFTFAEIMDYLRLHPELNASDHALFYTQLHARLANPWTSLVVVLVAVPFGAMSGRRNVFVGVASSIFLCLLYFAVLRLGLAVGTGGHMPPVLAAWLPNIIFGSIGFVMMVRAR